MWQALLGGLIGSVLGVVGSFVVAKQARQHSAHEALLDRYAVLLEAVEAASKVLLDIHLDQASLADPTVFDMNHHEWVLENKPPVRAALHAILLREHDEAMRARAEVLVSELFGSGNLRALEDDLVQRLRERHDRSLRMPNE